MGTGGNESTLTASREIELLRLCARRDFTRIGRAELEQQLSANLHWWMVLREAQRHGFIPLLYDFITRHHLLDRVPSEAAEAMVSAVRATAGRSLVLTVELIRIVNALTRERIAVVPFKGPVVAMAAYGSLSLRSFGDLDILVPPAELTAARRILGQLGYQPMLSMSAKEEESYLESECAFQLHHPERGHVVELHWRLSERNASLDLPVQEFRNRLRPMDLAGERVPTMCQEDLLLYLCVHGAKHQWERLEWVCCLAELIRNQPATDWERVFEQASRFRVRRILCLGLRLAESLCGAPLPEEVQRHLQAECAAQALAEQAEDALFQSAQGVPHYQQRGARYLFMLRAREDWRDKVRILAYSAFKTPHPEADEWVALPPHLAFLHHLFRPVRLASQYGAVAWRYWRDRRGQLAG